MRLVATIITTIAIVFVTLLFIFPNFGNLFNIANILKKTESSSSKRNISFVLGAVYEDFSFNAAGRALAEGKNLTLKTSVGTFENMEGVELVDYKGVISFEQSKMHLNGEFSGVVLGDAKISTSGKLNDVIEFDRITINGTSDEIKLHVNGYIISNEKTTAVNNTVVITDFSGEMGIDAVEKTLKIEGAAKNVTLVRSFA